MADNDETIYNNQPNTPGHICCLCECLPEIHTTYWKCPIFDNELICCHCCQIECLKTDIDQKFSTKLGNKITKEEINNACKKCGRNNAIQNDQLAIDLENNNPIVEVADDEKRSK